MAGFETPNQDDVDLITTQPKNIPRLNMFGMAAAEYAAQKDPELVQPLLRALFNMDSEYASEYAEYLMAHYGWKYLGD